MLMGDCLTTQVHLCPRAPIGRHQVDYEPSNNCTLALASDYHKCVECCLLPAPAQALLWLRIISALVPAPPQHAT